MRCDRNCMPGTIATLVAMCCMKCRRAISDGMIQLRVWSVMELVLSVAEVIRDTVQISYRTA